MAEANLNCCLTSKMTAQEFLDSFLFGIAPENGDTGERMKNEVIQQFIDTSYEYLETLYDISILPKKRTEMQDFFWDPAMKSFHEIHLNYAPILWDPSDRFRYPIKIKAYFGADIQELEFPDNWFRVNPQTATVHVFPTAASYGTFLHQFQQINATTSMFRSEFIPQYYDVEYISGMCPIPKFINSIVGKLAYIYIGNVLGDVAYGAGVASYSLGLDGLSQSLSTTQSAENNAYSARVKMYKEELKQELPLLRAKYGSLNFTGV